MRGLSAPVAFFTVAMVSSCGFNPTPKDGRLSCHLGCPTGYVCRQTDNRCYRANAVLHDGGSDGVVAEAGRDVAPDARRPDGIEGIGDAPLRADANRNDAASDSIPDVPAATGGGGGSGTGATSGGGSASSITAAGGSTGGAGGVTATGGKGGSIGTGGVVGSGGIVGTGGSAGTAGGSIGVGGAAGTSGSVATAGVIGSGGMGGSGGRTGTGGTSATGGSSGSGGKQGTGGTTQSGCTPACSADQDCINGACVPSNWGGTACSAQGECPSWAICCDGSNVRCGGTRLPAGDVTNPGQFVVSSDGLTVTDTITGLVWQRDGSGGRTGCTGTSNMCSGAEAKAYCAALVLGGVSGWRLPALMELMTIQDQTRVPAVDPAVFRATPGEAFWTSSPFAGKPSYGWNLNFYAGSTGEADIGTTFLYVRCVRGGSRCYPTSRFVVLDGGLVRDTLTKLVWQRQESATTMNWTAAQTYCSSAGSGFRLPTFKELSSIQDLTVAPPGPTIDQAAFPNALAADFWTSSSDAPAPASRAHYVNFSLGNSGTYVISTNCRVRCVR